MSLSREQRFFCNQQKDLFEYAQERNVDVKRFTRLFLNSDFCNRCLDVPYSVDQFADTMNWLEFLEKDCPIKENPFQKIKIPESIAGWIGFTYRHIQILTGMKSKDILEKIPVEKMIISYPGLHTIDEDEAAKILIKDFGL